MSGGAIYLEALRSIRALELGDTAERCIVTALDRAQPGPLPLLYDFGHDAGLAHARILERGVGLFVWFAAGNLADDVIDGDCDYLDSSAAPWVQFFLHHHGTALVARSVESVSPLVDAGRELALGASTEPLELDGEAAWNGDSFMRLARGIAGRQWSAYFHVLWHATDLATHASTYGMTFGTVSQIVEDIRTDDRRFFRLSGAEQIKLRAWARQSYESLQATNVPTFARVAKSFDRILDAG